MLFHPQWGLETKVTQNDWCGQVKTLKHLTRMSSKKTEMFKFINAEFNLCFHFPFIYKRVMQDFFKLN